jgi:phosphoglycerate kinase
VPAVLPHAAGLLVKKEVEAFGPLMTNPPRPYVAVLGGAKVSDKIKVIESLLSRVDTIIIGGAMAYTFLKARGEPVGKSLVEEGQVGFALGLLDRAKNRGVRVMLPVDHVVAHNMDGTALTETDHIFADSAAYDIGGRTRKSYANELANAKAIIFNGPMGVFEREIFKWGTQDVLAGAAAAHAAGALVVVGGGDSAAACEQLGFDDKVTHVSTGGGASLELLEGLDLPGLAALVD